MNNYIVTSNSKNFIEFHLIDNESLNMYPNVDVYYSGSLQHLYNYFEAMNKGACDLNISSDRFIFYHLFKTWAWIQADNGFEAAREFMKTVASTTDDYTNIFRHPFTPYRTIHEL